MRTWYRSICSGQSNVGGDVRRRRSQLGKEWGEEHSREKHEQRSYSRTGCGEEKKLKIRPVWLMWKEQGALCEAEVDGVCGSQAVLGLLSNLPRNSVFIWRTKENHERLKKKLTLISYILLLFF